MERSVDFVALHGVPLPSLKMLHKKRAVDTAPPLEDDVMATMAQMVSEGWRCLLPPFHCNGSSSQSSTRAILGVSTCGETIAILEKDGIYIHAPDIPLKQTQHLQYAADDRFCYFPFQCEELQASGPHAEMETELKEHSNMTESKDAKSTKATPSARVLKHPTSLMQCSNIACGLNHVVGITSGGEAFAVGLNLFGQLGDGTFTSKTRITLLPYFGGSPHNAGGVARKAFAGENCSFVLTTGGALYGWGDNRYRQLGLVAGAASLAKRENEDAFPDTSTEKEMTTDKLCGSNETQFVESASVSLPTKVECPLPYEQWKTVFCGFGHTVAITQSGSVCGWGLNLHGQLGLGHTQSPMKPTFVGLFLGLPVIHVACGIWHTLFLTMCNQVFIAGKSLELQYPSALPAILADSNDSSKLQLFPQYKCSDTEYDKFSDDDSGESEDANTDLSDSDTEGAPFYKCDGPKLVKALPFSVTAVATCGHLSAAIRENPSNGTRRLLVWGIYQRHLADASTTYAADMVEGVSGKQVPLFSRLPQEVNTSMHLRIHCTASNLLVWQER